MVTAGIGMTACPDLLPNNNVASPTHSCVLSYLISILLTFPCFSKPAAASHQDPRSRCVHCPELLRQPLLETHLGGLQQDTEPDKCQTRGLNYRLTHSTGHSPLKWTVVRAQSWPSNLYYADARRHIHHNGKRRSSDIIVASHLCQTGEAKQMRRACIVTYE